MLRSSAILWLLGLTACLAPSDFASSMLVPTGRSPQRPAGANDSLAVRRRAAEPVSYSQREVPRNRKLAVRLLAWNDFHGQLSPRRLTGRPIGGAAVLAAYLRKAAGGAPHVFFVHAGDHVGASPPSSALLQDEPSISFLNLLANEACKYGRATQPECNMIGTLGNHEFDEGERELLRLLRGGNHVSGPFLERPWRGARFPYVCANVVSADTGKTIVPPYVVQRAEGIPIAFIGAVLRGTPSAVLPSGVAKLKFLDEAEAINRYVPELRAAGVRTIVLLIHQGLNQPRYPGPTRSGLAAPSGALLEVLRALDDEIDVVVSGHTHDFTNALVQTNRGVPLLVTQAFSASTAYAEIDLVIDTESRDVVSKTGRVLPTWGDEGPGLEPDPKVAALVARAESRVAPMVNVAIGAARVHITRKQSEAGESALGNLVADAHRAALRSEFAIVNPGGIRADFEAGPITWGHVFTVQPFRDQLISLVLTGQQLYDLLDQQWGGEQPKGGRMLQISGFGYTWDPSVPEGGRRVVEVRDAYGPLGRDRRYTVTVNGFLAEGGDGFTVFRSAVEPKPGPIDLDAVIDYLRALPQPFAAQIEGRIRVRPPASTGRQAHEHR